MSKEYTLQISQIFSITPQAGSATVAFVVYSIRYSNDSLL